MVEQPTTPPAEIDEDALYQELKELRDFDCLPLPSHWFKKYNIPPRTTITPHDYIESNYAMKRALEPKDLPPLIIDEPQQGGKLVEAPPPEDIKVEVINRPFDWTPDKPFPAVLPMLKELPDPDAEKEKED